MAEFKPNGERAQKKFPGMRLTRAMAMDRIDHSFRTGGASGRTDAINKFNSRFNKGSQSGGFNNAEMKLANAWYKKAKESLKTKTKAKAKISKGTSRGSRGGGGGGVHKFGKGAMKRAVSQRIGKEIM
jgi:hypothetical protein